MLLIAGGTIPGISSTRRKRHFKFQNYSFNRHSPICQHSPNLSISQSFNGASRTRASVALVTYPSTHFVE